MFSFDFKSFKDISNKFTNNFNNNQNFNKFSEKFNKKHLLAILIAFGSFGYLIYLNMAENINYNVIL